ncbi:MAG TPA: hemerythrin domain-containing protein [Albitalea sp.]|nr:hemerythrin domain-containing protein [Albitalea sp.]
MKRSDALIPLSREHHEALVLARRAAGCNVDSGAARELREHVLRRWEAQFEPHFALEELALFPALAAVGHDMPVAAAVADHAELRQLVERLRRGDATALAAWGAAMDRHVRFEERTLFPLAQRVLDPVALAESMARPAPIPVPSP